MSEEAGTSGEPYDIPEDAAEASEADGVATIDNVPLDEAATELDQQVLDQLTEEELEALKDPELEDPTEAAGPVRLSRNFLLAEFHCCRGHCRPEPVPARAVPALKRLVVEVLQPMRNEFGTCSVFSGYRNAAHNAHVGGASASCHRYDVRPANPAADVAFARGNVQQWGDLARRRLNRLGVGGVGRYPGSGFVHVDLGPMRNW